MNYTKQDRVMSIEHMELAMHAMKRLHVAMRALDDKGEWSDTDQGRYDAMQAEWKELLLYVAQL